MTFHSKLTGDSIHAIHAFTFSDATARNVVTFTSEDIGKVAKQTDDNSYYILTDTTPTWAQIDSGGFDTFLELNDTLSSYSGQAGNVLQVNPGETALELGQNLTSTGSPTFTDLILIGNLTVQGTTTILDTQTLLVEDKNIELGNVPSPTNTTADGGGITLLGSDNKTITWINNTKAWTFNHAIQSIQTSTLNTYIDAISDGSAGSWGEAGFRIFTNQRANEWWIYMDDDGFSDLPNVKSLGFWGGGNNVLVLDGVTEFVGIGTGGSAPSHKLQVVGTTNTVSLLVEDNNITINKVASPTDVTADGGGITLKGAGDKTIQWLSATNAWTFNQSIDLLGNNYITTGSIVGGAIAGTSLTIDNLFLDGNTLSSLDTNGDVIISPNGTGETTINSALKVLGTISPITTNSDLILDAAIVGTGVVKVIDQLEIAGFTSQLLLTDTDNDKTFIVKNNLGDFSITEVGGNNSFKILGGAAVNSLKITANQVEIGTSLHVHIDTAGSVTASSVADGIVVEDSKNTGISILTPDANVGRVIFGSPSDPFGAFMAWSFSGSDFSVGTSKIGASFRLTGDQETTNLTLSGASGSELATFAKDVKIVGQIKITGGNPGNSKYLRSDPDGLATWGDVGWTDLGDDVVLIDNSNKVGIGTPTPAASAKLEVASTTRGFLSPRMTETQRDAISSPATGLKIYNTTVNKYEIFTGTVWDSFLTEALGTFTAQETFASTNVRFFGELGVPSSQQTWVDTATGIATIDLQDQTVFGVLKQVVRHNDNTTGGSTTSKITLTAQNWIDINNFGASYSGISRLDTVNGASGFFSGLQANAAENPLATGNRRYGILFDSDLGNLQLIEADNNPGNSVTMDGTGGNPLIPFDEWFRWECVVPAGLGAAQVFINGMLTTFVPTFIVNGGGLGTQIIVSSGSTGGANRVSYHDNFGTTIFEESATKTLVAATMDADIAQITIPEGKRDYTIILPDGNPRDIGSLLRVVVNNLFGTVTLQNQTPAAPEALFNGLAEIVFTVFSKEIVGGVNTVNSGNVYIGFKAEDVDRSSSIFAQLHSIIDQIPTDVNPTVITYTNHDAINGIGHSTTINTGELEILPGFKGTYFIMAQPQVGKDSGGVKVDFDMFLQVDRGSGFVDEPNSNIILTIKDFDITDTIVSAITIQLQVGDKVRMMQAVSNAAVGMGLKNTDPVVGPPSVPRTPSIIFTMSRVGGI